MTQLPSPKEAILVLGMHRSGTSALTRVLSLLGAGLPHQMLAVAQDNETGFWEPQEIVDLHDKLLHSVGSRWDDVSEFPRDWFGSPAAEGFRDRLIELVEATYQGAPLIVLKDPRICRFVPLWLAVLERLGTAPRVVIPVRNPLEVADSLKKRNDFPIAKSALLWLRHVLDVERDTRGLPRSFCCYERLLDDWKQVTDRIAADIGVAWPRASHRATIEIEGFLSESHRHNHHRRDNLEAHSQISPWVKMAYNALWDATRGDSQSLAATFDTIHDELQQADLAYGPLIADVETRIERTQGTLAAAEAERERLQGALTTAHSKLEQERAARQELSARTATERALLEEQLATALADRMDTEAALNDLIQSRFWRYTHLVRGAARRMRKGLSLVVRA